MAAPLRAVAGSRGEPLTEAIEVTERLKPPHLRHTLTDLIPTAEAQRCGPTEVVRVQVAEEAAGCDRTNLRIRASFPVGNLHASEFDEITPEALATATVDRVLHHVHIVLTQGESSRLAKSPPAKGVRPLN